jgi:hypothetical protein
MRAPVARGVHLRSKVLAHTPHNLRQMKGRVFEIVASAAVSAATAVLAACSNGECSGGAQRCGPDGTPQICEDTSAGNCGEDNILCFNSGSPSWTNQSACSNGASCVVAGGMAVCSMTKSTDPSCADGGSICFGNDVVECTGGYPVFVQNCASLTCKQDPSGYDYTRANAEGIAFVGNLRCAYCSNGSEVSNAGCATGRTYTCANNSIFLCLCGDIQGTPNTACADGGPPETCVLVQRPGTTQIGYVDSFCALSSQPDPQCGDKVESSYCGSDGFEVSCSDGYDVPPPGTSTSCH